MSKTHPLEEENDSRKRKRQRTLEELPSSSSTLPIQAKSGTVSHMILKNFMCHSHLEVRFDNNINYIVGRNGSGKSAILTALVVGLGGKASITNRGNSVKGFIKAGKNSATVEITLRNHDVMAYKPNLYGNQITIIRHFLNSGSGNYKIKSVTGEVISSQSKEVQRICQAFDIQVDNPVCILNQDVSRNFLNTKDPKQKFILFMRATQLDSLKEKYENFHANKTKTVLIFKEKEIMYKELKKKRDDAKAKLESQKNACRLKEKVTLLQREVLWAKVRDAEESMNEQKARVDKLKQEQHAMRENLSGETNKQATINEKIEALRQQEYELQQMIENQNTPQNLLVRTLGEIKETLNEKCREKRIVQKDIALKTGNCNILELEITKVKENFAQMEQEKLKHLEAMANLQKEIDKTNELLETAQNEHFQLRNSKNRLHEEEISLKDEMKQLEAQIEQTTSRLKAFKNESNVLPQYGSDMPRIIAAINTAKEEFHHLPRGPLGSYIRLKDGKWAVAVEGYLGTGILRAFAVDNMKDNQLLMNILNRICTRDKPMIITSKFFFREEDINVSNNLVKPIDGCVSIYSVLEFSDPVARNCIIDQSGIENILLIPTTDKAMELMSDRRRVPRNCNQGITINADVFYPAPNYKFYGSNYHTAQYLQVSKLDMIKQLQQKLKSLSDAKKAVINQHESVHQEFVAQFSKEKELEKKVIELSTIRRSLNRQLEELRNESEFETANAQTMENELKELKRLIDERTAVSQKIEEDIKEIQRKVTKKEEKLENLKTIVRGYEERLEPLHQQIQELTTNLKDFEVNKRFAAKRLNDVDNKIKGAESDLLSKKQKVSKYTEEASNGGDRLPELRQVTHIVEELNATQREINKIEANLESTEELSTQYNIYKEKYSQLTNIMINLKDDVKELQKAASKQAQRYKRSEDYFIVCLKDSFDQILQVRQFKGNINIDIQNKRLELLVIPQQGSQGNSNTSNLSGGERSFSTVAFLYSLWQCTDFPFYFLDEFDVFMDKMNRDMALGLLKDHAKQNPNLQFVFLTPQDISSVMNDKAVVVHRLEDPKRGLEN